MKKSLLVVFVSLFVYSSALAQALSPPWPEGSFSSYFGPTQAFKLTIKSENGIVSVLEVPKGVFLNVVATEEQNPDFKPGDGFPLTLFGDITLRTRRHDEIGADESMIAHKFMVQSPLEMTLRNVVLLVDLVE